MTIICITGLPGSGKGEVVRILKEEHGMPVVTMGEVVKEYVVKAGLETSREVVGPFANSEREKYGNEIWAKRTVDKVKEVMVEDVVIDGVRTPLEVKIFREEFGSKVALISVSCSREIRMKRIFARGREDDSLDEKGFDSRVERELSWGLGDAVEMADYAIVNEGSLEELHGQLMEICKRIKGC